MHAKRPIRSTIWSRKNCTRKEASGARFGAQEVACEKTIWRTIWSTKSCARKGPSGTRFEAQKVAREKAHPGHDLKHKKRHAKKSIWNMIWSTKSCTKKQSEAWCGAQKVARGKNRSGARFEAQKVEKTWHDFFCKMKLCSVQFWKIWMESKTLGNMRNQFFKLSIANYVEWLRWANWPGTVKKTLQTNHEGPE